MLVLCPDLTFGQIVIALLRITDYSTTYCQSIPGNIHSTVLNDEPSNSIPVPYPVLKHLRNNRCFVQALNNDIGESDRLGIASVIVNVHKLRSSNGEHGKVAYHDRPYG